MITSFSGQNYVATTFWRNYNVIITSCVRWDGTPVMLLHLWSSWKCDTPSCSFGNTPVSRFGTFRFGPADLPGPVAASSSIRSPSVQYIEHDTDVTCLSPNHRLLNHLFRLTANKTSKFHITSSFWWFILRHKLQWNLIISFFIQEIIPNGVCKTAAQPFCIGFNMLKLSLSSGSS